MEDPVAMPSTTSIKHSAMGYIGPIVPNHNEILQLKPTASSMLGVPFGKVSRMLIDVLGGS
jgi:hypothetical protein